MLPIFISIIVYLSLYSNDTSVDCEIEIPWSISLLEIFILKKTSNNKQPFCYSRNCWVRSRRIDHDWTQFLTMNSLQEVSSQRHYHPYVVWLHQSSLLWTTKTLQGKLTKTSINYGTRRRCRSLVGIAAVFLFSVGFSLFQFQKI